MASRRLQLEQTAITDMAWWLANNRRALKRIFELAAEALDTPFSGKGKPEPLKGNYAGYWSRRITDEHRLIYKVTDEIISLVSCKGHYE